MPQGFLEEQSGVQADRTSHERIDECERLALQSISAIDRYRSDPDRVEAAKHLRIHFQGLCDKEGMEIEAACRIDDRVVEEAEPAYQRILRYVELSRAILNNDFETLLKSLDAEGLQCIIQMAFDTGYDLREKRSEADEIVTERFLVRVAKAVKLSAEITDKSAEIRNARSAAINDFLKLEMRRNPELSKSKLARQIARRQPEEIRNSETGEYLGYEAIRSRLKKF